MLKRKLTAEQFAALDVTLQGLYLLKGGEYVLKLEGSDPDTDNFRTLAQTAQAEKAQLQLDLDKANKALAEQTAGSAAAIEAATTAAKESQARAVALLLQKERAALVGTVASNFTAPALVARDVETRVQVEYDEATGEVKTKILDAKGGETTLDALSNEYLSRPDLAGIIAKKPSRGAMDTPAGTEVPKATDAPTRSYAPQDRSKLISDLKAKIQDVGKED